MENMSRIQTTSDHLVCMYVNVGQGLKLRTIELFLNMVRYFSYYSSSFCVFHLVLEVAMCAFQLQKTFV